MRLMSVQIFNDIVLFLSVFYMLCALHIYPHSTLCFLGKFFNLDKLRFQDAFLGVLNQPITITSKSVPVGLSLTGLISLCHLMQ